MKHRLEGMLAVALATALAPGCAMLSDNLIVATYTKTGLHVTANGTTPTDAVFGVKTFQGVNAPVDVRKDGAAPSVASAIHIGNAWLGGLSVATVLATGDAADKVAEHPEMLRALSDATITTQPAPAQ